MRPSRRKTEKTVLPGRNERPNLFVVEGEKPVLEEGERPALIVRKKRRKMPRYVKIFLFFLLGYLAVSFLIGGYQLMKLNAEIRILRQEQESLLQEQKLLQQEIEGLSDPEVIEKIARESLGMVKPGETVVIPAVPDSKIPLKSKDGEIIYD